MEVGVVLVEGFLHGTGALVVGDVESGGCTVLLEVLLARLPGLSDIQGWFLRSWAWMELVP